MSATPRSARVPGHLHHKPSGRGRVRLNGRDFYTGPSGSAEAAAEYARLVAEWERNGRRLPTTHQPLNPEKLTVTALLVAYDKYAEGVDPAGV